MTSEEMEHTSQSAVEGAGRAEGLPAAEDCPEEDPLAAENYRPGWIDPDDPFAGLD